MQKIWGQRLSDHHRFLPCIVAELAKEVSFPENHGTVYHERGTRAYFVLRGDNPLNEPTAEVFIRTKMGNLRVRELPWDHFRFADIDNVPSKIGERCWFGTQDEMRSMVEKIRGKIQGSEVAPMDFSVPIELD
jgi:hypothetical protein